MSLNAYLIALTAPTKLADTTDLLAVGLSLYLALGIVQVASTVGISSLRRKAETLRLYVVQNRKTGKFAVARDVSLQVHAAEVDADGVNRTILWLVCLCLSFAIPYFVWAVFASELWITGFQLLLLALAYIGVPIILFFTGLLLIRKKTKPAREALRDAYKSL